MTMKSCLKEIMNCPNGNHIFLQSSQIVQIIGIKPFKNQILYIISDGTHFCSSFLIPRTDHFQLFQLIEFKKFYIKIIQDDLPVLIINPIKIISNLKDCIGQPSQLNEFSNIPSLRLIKYNCSQEITPISELNIYQPLTIHVRVINKNPNHTIPYIQLLDSKNDQINGEFDKLTFDLFYKKVKQSRVYIISGFEYQNINLDKSSIKFTKSSTFSEVGDDFTINLPLKLMKLDEIDQIDKESFYQDLKAIIVDVGSFERLKNESFYRVLLLTDDSNCTIQLRLYDSYAISIQESDVGQVIIIKSAKINNKYGYKFVSIENFSYVKILDTSHHLGKELFDWYESIQGSVGNFNHLSNKKKFTLSEIRSKNLGKSKEDYFIVEAKLEAILVNGVFNSFNDEKFGIKSNYVPITDRGEKFIIFYDTCPFKCKREFKKLKLKEGTKKYYCPECQKEIDKPRVLYQFDALFEDENGNKEVFKVKTFNQGIGEIIIGKSAEKWKLETEDLPKEKKIELTKSCLIKYHMEVLAEPDKKGLKPYPLMTIQKIFPIFDEK